MSSRRLGVAVATLSIAVVLAGCGSNGGSRSAQAVDTSPAVAPAAATDAYGNGGYAAGNDVQAGADPTATSPYSAEASPDDGYGASSAAPAAAPAKAAPAKAKAKAAAKPKARLATELIAANQAELGDVVTDQHGWILYRFDKDTPKPAKSNCNGKCATTWPPVIVDGKPELKGVSADLVGMVKRADGNMQLTLHGWPLYYYAKDTKVGDWKGQGVGGTWFVSTKEGKKNLTCLPKDMTAPAVAAVAAEHRMADQLIGKQLPGIGDVVMDQHGWILYRFDKDKPEPPTSNCTGACAVTWPPVLVQGMPHVMGVDPAAVGAVRRDDGTWQVTLKGWPLYYYSKDAKAGQWKGQGVGGTWFVVTPEGKKNLNCVNMSAAPSTAVQSGSSGYGSGSSSGSSGYSSGSMSSSSGSSGYSSAGSGYSSSGY